MPPADAPIVWKDGGSEPFVWAEKDKVWAAVWAQDDIFIAWVSGGRPDLKRQVSHHLTESAAKEWCSVQMAERQ